MLVGIVHVLKLENPSVRSKEVTIQIASKDLVLHFLRQLVVDVACILVLNCHEQIVFPTVLKVLLDSTFILKCNRLVEVKPPQCSPKHEELFVLIQGLVERFEKLY